MAQNLLINGATYNSVQSISVPKSGGGTAVFPDTSDATAVASNIAQGKTAYVNGSKVTGTSTGGDSKSEYPSVILPGNTPIFVSENKTFFTNSSTIQATGMSLAMPLTGTFRFNWTLHVQGSGDAISRIYLNGVAQGSETTHSSSTPGNYSLDLICATGDVVELWLRSGGSLARVCAGGLVASIDWDVSALYPEEIEAGNTLMLVSVQKGYVIGSTTLTASGITLTIPKDGAYRISYGAVSQTAGQAARARIYRNGTAETTETSNTTTTAASYSFDLECEAGDVLELYVRSGGSSQRASFGGLMASIDWKIEITSNLRDVSGVDAAAGDVRQGKKIMTLEGEVVGTLVPGGSSLPDPIVAGDTVVYTPSPNMEKTSSSTISNSGLTITISLAGVYRFRWFSMTTSTTPTTYPAQSRLYQNGIAVGTLIQNNTESVQKHTLDVTCAAGDVIALWAAEPSNGWFACVVGGFAACIDWDNGF